MDSVRICRKPFCRDKVTARILLSKPLQLLIDPFILDASCTECGFSQIIPESSYDKRNVGSIQCLS